MHELIFITRHKNKKILNANPFSKAILCSIEKHLETNFGHSLTDLGNSIILTLKVSFHLKILDFNIKK